MTKNRIKAYWLLLTILIFATAMVLSAGETQARYANTISWNTLVENNNDLVRSNLLRNVSEPPVTILLGELGEDGIEIPITLTSEINTEGVLAWSRSGAPETPEEELPEEKNGDEGAGEPEPAEAEPAEEEAEPEKPHPEYLVHVEMTSQETETDKDFVHENNQFIQLTAGETVTVMMKLEPGLLATTELQEATDVYVTVSWGNTLTGKFKVTLPPAQMQPEETEPEETEPEVPETTESAVPETTEATEPETTEPTEPETTEPTVPETTAPDAADPRDALKNKLDGIFGLRPESDPAVTEEEPQEEEPEEQEPDSTEPAETTPVPPVIRVDAVARMTLSEELALQIHVPDEITGIQIGLGLEVSEAAGSDVPQMENTVLPAFTCYSLDQGQSYFMLYYPGNVQLETTPGETASLLLDFSETNLDTDELILTFMGRRQDSLWGTGVCVVGIEPDYKVVLSTRYLTPGTPLEIDIPEEWEGYAMEYRIEKLTCTWTQDEKPASIAYQYVNPEEAGILVSMDSSLGKLTLETGSMLPTAGTYRIVMNWSSEDIRTKQVQENFFINYLAYSDVLKTGGAEQ